MFFTLVRPALIQQGHESMYIYISTSYTYIHVYRNAKSCIQQSNILGQLTFRLCRSTANQIKVFKDDKQMETHSYIQSSLPQRR